MKKFEEYMKKVGDRNSLYRLISVNFPIKKVLYPGSYVDITPSFYFPYTVYVDSDKKAKKFFKDGQKIKDFIEIGHMRNELAHKNFATFPLEKTTEEVYSLYKNAEKFIYYLESKFSK